jgi:hypothetical protein
VGILQCEPRKELNRKACRYLANVETPEGGLSVVIGLEAMTSEELSIQITISDAAWVGSIYRQRDVWTRTEREGPMFGAPLALYCSLIAFIRED